MLFRSSIPVRHSLLLSTCLILIFPIGLLADTSERHTPLVKAVSACKDSVVNLRGRKSVPLDDSPASNNEMKQVNGMGTGVVIDPRGYILTNYHVVQGVHQIQVTTGDKEKSIGQLLAHDPETDLALLKINTTSQLPTIPIGSSSDLMLAETVAAVGNAYGYEHTITVGIVSQLGRTVQVNDDQIYRNLIQTDAPINPGNSGGPLINLDGEMVGINVAVRIGAQGIAFAIPVNDAMEIASRLMAQHVEESSAVRHGLKVATLFENHQPVMVVDGVEPLSPADRAGIEKGDRINQINGADVFRSLDLHSAMLSMSTADELSLDVKHRGQIKQISFKLGERGQRTLANQSAWQMLILRASSSIADECHIGVVSELTATTPEPAKLRRYSLTRLTFRLRI